MPKLRWHCPTCIHKDKDAWAHPCDKCSILGGEKSYYEKRTKKTKVTAHLDLGIHSTDQDNSLF
jgi:hypothetical protein